MCNPNIWLKRPNVVWANDYVNKQNFKKLTRSLGQWNEVQWHTSKLIILGTSENSDCIEIVSLLTIFKNEIIDCFIISTDKKIQYIRLKIHYV